VTTLGDSLLWPRRTLPVAGPYNRIAQDETGALNANWLARRNLRLVAEGTWDFPTDHPRADLGLMTAF